MQSWPMRYECTTCGRGSANQSPPSISIGRKRLAIRHRQQPSSTADDGYQFGRSLCALLSRCSVRRTKSQSAPLVFNQLKVADYT